MERRYTTAELLGLCADSNGRWSGEALKRIKQVERGMFFCTPRHKYKQMRECRLIPEFGDDYREVRVYWIEH